MKGDLSLPEIGRRSVLSFLVAIPIVSMGIPAFASDPNDPLPSWNDSGSKAAILAFVERVTKPGSPDFVPEAERVATFDNDGALWAEQPMYSQLLFAPDRVEALAPQHPEWLTKEPFASLLGFKTYIVSGGGIEFMRPWTERAYGIPPENIVGSSAKLKFELRDGKAVLVRLPEVDFIDDGPGKPVGINEQIGRRPIAAFGNSDGDLQMLQYAMSGDGARFGLIVHPTDAVREWAYGRESHVGPLDKALHEAETKGWAVVDMNADWKTIFPFGGK
jgi:hypothetical protein